MTATRLSNLSLAAAALCLAAPAFAQSTSVVSTPVSGTIGNANSTLNRNALAVTPDGRFVVFHSDASNLVAVDSGFRDVFVRDLVAGSTERISLTSIETEPNGSSFNGSISDNGRFVAFESNAQNLAAGDANFTTDVFVRDRQLGITTIVSVSTGGAIGNAASEHAAISSDGAFIAFASDATNLVPNDPNGLRDVFVRDLIQARTKMVSLASNGLSDQPTISGDGRYIAFSTFATNLVANDTLGFLDIVLRDMTGTSFELISATGAGAFAAGASYGPSLSADGGRVVFTSDAANLASVGSNLNNVFLRDRSAGTTSLVNAAGGVVSNASAILGRIAKNGQYATFSSAASNLTSGHTGSRIDAFVVQFSNGAVQRLSALPGNAVGEPSANILQVGGVSDDGRFGLFSTAADNLVAGDTGAFEDVLLRDQQKDWFIDLDGDLYGDESSILAASFQPVGYMDVGGDCDDTNPNINPGATEICNGIDDNCNGATDEIAWQSYCVQSTSQNGCMPHLSATGFPSASATSGFSLEMDGLDGQRPCSLIYGLGSTTVAWGFGSNSARCVAFPWTRVTTFGSNGSSGACDGSFSIDWLAFMAAHPAGQGQPILPGQAFYIQGWYRDPSAVKNSNLTDAVSFVLCP